MRVLILLLALAALPLAEGQAPLPSPLRPDGSSGAAPEPAPGSPGEPSPVRVAAGLDAAVNLVFGPDGTLYYGTWKTGEVRPIVNGRPGPVLFDVGNPAWGNERGFVGLAVDGAGSFYTFTTYDRAGGGWFNRLSRWDPGAGGYAERPLLDNLAAGDWHNAGRIEVDPRDGTLWVAYGDVNHKPSSQDPADLRGKLLHMTRDGRSVPGNLGPQSLAWSLGHRQPFGFALDGRNGRVMVAENMDKKNDEVSFVEAGGNYGWPACEGPCLPANAAHVDPVLYWPVTIGPTSGAFLGGHFYFGEFNFGRLHRIFEHDGRWWDEVVYTHTSPPILALEPGPEGNTLYFTTWSDVWRLTFPNVAPPDPGNGTGGGPPGNGSGPPGGPARADTPGPTPLLLLATAALVAAGRRPGRR